MKTYDRINRWIVKYIIIFFIINILNVTATGANITPHQAAVNKTRAELSADQAELNLDKAKLKVAQLERNIITAAIDVNNANQKKCRAKLNSLHHHISHQGSLQMNIAHDPVEPLVPKNLYEQYSGQQEALTAKNLSHSALISAYTDLIEKHEAMKYYPQKKSCASSDQDEIREQIRNQKASNLTAQNKDLRNLESLKWELRLEQEAVNIDVDKQDAVWFWADVKEYLPMLTRYIYQNVRDLFKTEGNPDDESDITQCKQKLALHEKNLILREQARARRLQNLAWIDEDISLLQLPIALYEEQDTTFITQKQKSIKQDLVQLEQYIEQPLSENYPARFIEYLIIAAWRGIFSKSNPKTE